MTDWRDTVLADVAALPSRTGKADEVSKVQTDFLAGAHSIVLEAARLRRVSTGTYLRRAALAMACHDLGIPFSDAMQRDSRAANPLNFPLDDPTGDRFGEWEIRRLCGEVVDV